MPISASIYSAIRPTVAPESPIDQQTKMLQLRSLMDAQSMNALQRQQMERGIADDAATAEAYRASAGDPVKLREALYGRGLYKPAIAAEKARLETEKTRGEIEKTSLENVTKSTVIHRDQLANVNNPASAAAWVRAGYDDPYLKPLMARAGTVDEAIARIPQDPQAFAQWKQQNALGATKFIEMNKPTIHMQDTGGVSNVLSIPGLGGAPLTLSSTAKTETPEGRAQRVLGYANLAETKRAHGVSEDRARNVADAGKWTNDLDRGLQINAATGETRPITTGGAPLGQKEKPLNEGQGKATAFGMRARAAADILDSVGQDGQIQPGKLKRMAESIPLVGEGAGTMTNWTQSEAQQKVEQAQRDFINSVLRLESGATIQQAEFDNAKKQYFPQPGDSAGVIAQKKQNRETEIAALGVMAGPGATNIRNVAPRVKPTVPDSAPAATAPVKPKIGAKVDGYTYRGGDPSKPESWTR